MEKTHVRQVTWFVGVVSFVTLACVLVPQKPPDIIRSTHTMKNGVALVPHGAQPNISTRNTVPEVPADMEDDEVCPFEDTDGRTTVGVTHNGDVPFSELVVRADEGEKKATITYSDILIEPGFYTVLLASYRSREDALPSAFEEGWFVRLLDKHGAEVGRTASLRDMRDDEEMVIERVESSMSIGEPVTSLVFQHVAYPSTSAQPVTPVCVAFDRITEVSEQLSMLDGDSVSFRDGTVSHDAQQSAPPELQASVVSGPENVPYALVLTLLASLGFLVFLSFGKEACDHTHTV